MFITLLHVHGRCLLIRSQNTPHIHNVAEGSTENGYIKVSLYARCLWLLARHSILSHAKFAKIKSYSKPNRSEQNWKIGSPA